MHRHEDYEYIAFKALQRGEKTLNESERGLLYGISNEERDLGYQSGAAGLFLAPVTVDNAAQSILTEANVFRKLGRVIQTTGHTVSTPMAISLAVGSTSEYSQSTGGSPFANDTALKFGLVNHDRNATPVYHPIGMVTNRVSIRVSQELLEDSANGGVDVVEQIALSGAMALADQELAVFFNGLGINGTTRLTTSMGVSTWVAQDSARVNVVGDSTVTKQVQFESYLALGAQYLENATLLLDPQLYSNFDGVSPNTLRREVNLYGTPVQFTNYFSPGSYTVDDIKGLLGDFRFFVVADHVSGLMMRRYDEVSAGNGQVTFHLQKRFGGGITNDAAFRGIVL